MDKVFIIAQMEQAHTDAVASGLQLAKQLNKTAEVFAYTYAYFSGAESYNPRLVSVAQKQLMDQRQTDLKQHLAALNDEDVPVHMVWSKYLFEHACHHSIRHGFDLMVKAVHHADHYLPTDWQLIRHTRIPLLLLTDNPLHKSNTILMAVDLATHDPIKQQLNSVVAAYGKQLAKATGAQLHLAYILRVPKVLRDMDLLDCDALVKKAYKDHQKQIAKFNMDPGSVHIIAGEPELCLYELACRLKSQYFVIGARQRQGVLGHIIGNTAESVLGRMRTNVLIIPADDQLLAPLT
ncbi:MAG: universal stress protein [Shewanella psychromarinicola]|jgi:universal stress protein E|uniref:Universal stress protein UspA n=1 Tax=Shewanella psychromarinicola TaxID=2487742 RepID=A0A3N4DNY2_9GAMM|nr:MULTISPECIES: universal stress protein [Shewanella]AZG35560.1 universal stress protein UspA [Shewanella psychromarinicola]MCL1081412.1 universal stress protein [Shewanella psychromarinicola]PKG76881.1 universal stress protein UspA [Shewanella sp. Actino-trap-3]RPA23310.1 universal stress protein UspA [Shewanella psychromarinicola]|tara:strand:- start:17524 stop:18402 length:879 start_codon:yes stop_codon:yes gene_type:complete